MEAKKTTENRKTTLNHASETKPKRFANTLLNQFRTRRKRQKKSKSLQNQENGVNSGNCLPNELSIQAYSRISDAFTPNKGSKSQIACYSIKSSLSDSVSDPFCFYNDSNSLSKTPSNSNTALDENDLTKCSSFKYQHSASQLKIRSKISEPIFRNTTNRNKMINHPVHLLRERALGKSRDKRRHSSACTPSFLLTNPLIVCSSNNYINPFISRLLCDTKLIKRKECIDHDLDHIPHHRTVKEKKLSLPLNTSSYEIQAQRNAPFWKKNVLRSISFSELDTCFLQAILSLDRTGSYLISVGPPSSICDFTSIYKSSIYRELRRSTSPSSCPDVQIFQPCLFIPKLTLSYFSIPSPETLYQQKKEHVFKKFTKFSPLTSDINSCNHDTLQFNAGRSKKRSITTSPLVFAIPLQMERRILNTNLMSQSFDFTSPDSFPIQILTSQDLAIIIIFLHPSHPLQDEAEADPPLGKVIIAPNPSSSSFFKEFTQTFHCSNVPMRGCTTTPTIQNLLWPSHFIPTLPPSMKNKVEYLSEEESVISNAIINKCKGYVLFHDEEDGYRMTWICRNPCFLPTIHHESENNDATSSTPTRFQFYPKNSNIITIPHNMSWDMYHSDALTCLAAKCVVSTRSSSTGDLFLPLEAYLHVDILFDDILKRHLRDKQYTIPEFYYNLISISDQGRTAYLVLAFNNEKGFISPSLELENIKLPSLNDEKKAGAVAVFLHIDLFDQSYDEIKWIQHKKSNPPNKDFLRRWSNNLAILHRMKEVGISDFHCNQDASKEVMEIHNHVHETKMTFESRNTQLRNKTLGYGSNSFESFTTKINFSALYPFCDITSNQAVLSQKPVSKIECKEAPIELKYG